jgi:hypothetical protein
MPGIFIVLMTILIADCVICIVINTEAAKTICGYVIYAVLAWVMLIAIVRLVLSHWRTVRKSRQARREAPKLKGAVPIGSLASERQALLLNMLVHVLPGVAMYAHQEKPEVIVVAVDYIETNNHLTIRLVSLPTTERVLYYDKSLLADFEDFRLIDVDSRNDALSVSRSKGSLLIDERTLSEEEGTPSVVLEHISREMKELRPATALEVLNCNELFSNFEKRYRLIWHSNSNGDISPNHPDKTAV